MLYALTEDSIFLEGDAETLKLTIDKLVAFIADKIDAFVVIDKLAQTHHGWICIEEVDEYLTKWFIDYDNATIYTRLAMFRALLMEQGHCMVLALALLAISCREASKLGWEDVVVNIVGPWLDNYGVEVGDQGSAFDMMRFTQLMNSLVYDADGKPKQ